MTDTETIISKVRKLIALASSPYEEEARSAAFKAAEMIREFQLDVVDPVSVRDTYRERVDNKYRDRRGDDEWPRWVPIMSRYVGRCRACGDTYDVGDDVLWKKGEGCMHATCGAPL